MNKILMSAFLLLLLSGCSIQVGEVSSDEVETQAFEISTTEDGGNETEEVEQTKQDPAAETTQESDEEQSTETSPEESATPLVIEDSATEEEQKSAVILTEDYLREKNELIEDANTFVQYDGTIGDYILVRHSTLVDGHSSTNGRYAIQLTSGEITDVTNAEDFDHFFN